MDSDAADTIAQLVEFSIKIVSKGNKIYHFEDRSTAENQNLGNILNDLVLIQTRLRQSPNPFAAMAVSRKMGRLSLLEQLNKAKA